MKFPPPGTRVAVGLSGGVDSAVSAALLKEHGCSVIGVTMSVWDPSFPVSSTGDGGCWGPGESLHVAAAADVARKFDIPHRIVTLAEDFQTHVLEYVRNEYRAGRTPNPCIQCNRRLKFGMLPRRAREAGLAFDFFATGHYARCRTDPASGRPQLRRARDAAKDQSYFLAHLTRAQLANLVFPLGEQTKAEVREKARTLGLDEQAERSESQDFLGAQGVERLFAAHPPPPGDIVDETGRILGRHRGLVYYTIGQRKGLGIGGAGEPFYVIGLDTKHNQIIAGKHSALLRSSFRASGCSWLAWDRPPSTPFRAGVCLRLRTPPAPAVVTPDPDAPAAAVRVVFDTPQAPVSPGQSAVFYQGDRVLGAGIIER